MDQHENSSHHIECTIFIHWKPATLFRCQAICTLQWLRTNNKLLSNDLLQNRTHSNLSRLTIEKYTFTDSVFLSFAKFITGHTGGWIVKKQSDNIEVKKNIAIFVIKRHWVENQRTVLIAIIHSRINRIRHPIQRMTKGYSFGFGLTTFFMSPLHLILLAWEIHCHGNLVK